MKHMLSVLLVLSFVSASQGADRKLGNVILVEREIQDIYSTCLKNMDSPTDKPQNFFSCSMKYITAGEWPVSSGIAFRLINEKCSVIGEALKGTLLITFATSRSPSSFEGARDCLNRAISNLKDPVKSLVYTVE